MREIFRKYARFLVISCTIIVVQTNSITTDFQAVQTFDFQHNWMLNWTAKNIWYWIPTIKSWQWRYIWTSSSSGYQWWIIPPMNIYVKEIKKYKIRFYKPSTTTSSRWTAVAVSDSTEATCIEYWRNLSSWWHLIVRINETIVNSLSVVDLTWELTIEMIFESNWHITVNLANASNTYTYDVWNYWSTFKTLRSNNDLWLHIARWNDNKNYIRKVEIIS